MPGGPNLPDEADNHLVELAVAGRATALVTYNPRNPHILQPFGVHTCRLRGVDVLAPRQEGCQ